VAPGACRRSWWVLVHLIQSRPLIVFDPGLTVDEVSLYSDRIRLWGELNTAWLGIFQTQKDILESGQQIHYPETLMTQEFIKKMAKDLIRMCDAVEKHGLVDYQYGVAEEQIIMSEFFLKNVHIVMKVDLIFQFFRNASIFKSQERALSKTPA
jgi:hypothetical protein